MDDKQKQFFDQLTKKVKDTSEKQSDVKDKTIEKLTTFTEKVVNFLDKNIKHPTSKQTKESVKNITINVTQNILNYNLSVKKRIDDILKLFDQIIDFTDKIKKEEDNIESLIYKIGKEKETKDSQKEKIEKKNIKEEEKYIKDEKRYTKQKTDKKNIEEKKKEEKRYGYLKSYREKSNKILEKIRSVDVESIRKAKVSLDKVNKKYGGKFFTKVIAPVLNWFSETSIQIDNILSFMFDKGVAVFSWLKNFALHPIQSMWKLTKTLAKIGWSTISTIFTVLAWPVKKTVGLLAKVVQTVLTSSILILGPLLFLVGWLVWDFLDRFAEPIILIISSAWKHISNKIHDFLITLYESKIGQSITNFFMKKIPNIIKGIFTSETAIALRDTVWGWIKEKWGVSKEKIKEWYEFGKEKVFNFLDKISGIYDTVLFIASLFNKFPLNIFVPDSLNPILLQIETEYYRRGTMVSARQWVQKQREENIRKKENRKKKEKQKNKKEEIVPNNATKNLEESSKVDAKIANSALSQIKPAKVMVETNIPKIKPKHPNISPKQNISKPFFDDINKVKDNIGLNKIDMLPLQSSLSIIDKRSTIQPSNVNVSLMTSDGIDKIDIAKQLEVINKKLSKINSLPPKEKAKKLKEKIALLREFNKLETNTSIESKELLKELSENDPHYGKMVDALIYYSDINKKEKMLDSMTEEEKERINDDIKSTLYRISELNAEIILNNVAGMPNTKLDPLTKESITIDNNKIKIHNNWIKDKFFKHIFYGNNSSNDVKQIADEMSITEQEFGGIITSESLAIIGEGRHPEMVIPINTDGIKFIAQSLSEFNVSELINDSKINKRKPSLNKKIIRQSSSNNPSATKTVYNMKLLSSGIIGI